MRVGSLFDGYTVGWQTTDLVFNNNPKLPLQTKKEFVTDPGESHEGTITVRYVKCVFLNV